MRSDGSGCSSRANTPPSPNWPNGEGIAPSYMTRVLRLTLLAPDIIEGILDGKQGAGGDAGARSGALPAHMAASDNAFFSVGRKLQSEGLTREV